MAVAWTLQRANGETKTLEDWGINSATCKFANLDFDTCELGFAAADLLGNLPFDDEEELLLLRGGVGYFRGRITSEKVSAFGGNEGNTLLLSGPWWYLATLFYLVSTPMAVDGTVNPVASDPSGLLQLGDFPPGTIVDEESTDIFVGGTITDTSATIGKIIAWAISKGAPIAAGIIDPGVYIPLDKITNVTCSDLIMRVLRWSPGLNSWWDYSVDPPTLNIRATANRPVVEIDIATKTIEQIELTRQVAPLVTGVTIAYVRIHQRNGIEFQTIVYDRAGPNPDGLNALFVSVPLLGSYLIDNPDPTQPPILVPEGDTPVGLAQRLYDAYSVTIFDGRVALIDDDVPVTAWLSQTLRILNGAPSWGAAAAVMDIQQASVNIQEGRSELTIGTPKRLGPVTLARLNPSPGSSGGSAPDPTPFPPVTPTVPPPATPDPRMEFGKPNQPNVILGKEYNLQCPGASGDTIFCVQIDEIDVYDAPLVIDEFGLSTGGNFIATVTYEDLIAVGCAEGGTTSLHGITFGRAHHVTGICMTTICGGGSGAIRRKKGRVNQSNPKLIIPV